MSVTLWHTISAFLRKAGVGSEAKMNDDSFLKGKRILAVDDETDVLEVITEQLHDTEVLTADNYSRAKELLESQKFDLVILDIMGVKGFELLKICGDRKLPAAMLTARAVTVDAINQSLKLGAVSFLPKDELGNLRSLVSEILEGLEQGKSHWAKLVERLGPLFRDKFGIMWEDPDRPTDPPVYYA